MFARVCELHIKPERKAELLRMMKNDILPLFEQYNGFFDLIPLELDTHPRKFFTISLWHDEEDARTYAKESFPKIYDMLEPFLAAPITVKHGTIDESIPKNFLATVPA
jgi:quinol monooxygenase YgiN